LPAGARAIAWHPLLARGVVGILDRAGSPTLHAFEYDKKTRTVALDEIEVVTDAVSAVGWSPDGSLLAVATYGVTPQLWVFAVEGDAFVLRTQITLPLAGDSKVYACAWNAQSNTLIIGCNASLHAPQLLAYRVDENEIILLAQEAFDAHASSVSFMPRHDDVFFVGLAGGSAQPKLRSYRLTDGGIEPYLNYEMETDVYDMAWHDQGRLFTLLTKTEQGYGQLVVYEQKGEKIVRCDVLTASDRQYRIDWAAHDTVAVGIDQRGVVQQYITDTALHLHDVTIVCNSPVHLQVPLCMEGNVLLHGNLHVLQVPENAVWYLKPNTSTHVRQIYISGPDVIHIRGEEGSAIIFDEVRIQVPACALYVPGELRGVCHIQGVFEGTLVMTPQSRVLLTGDTELVGSFAIAGDVVFQGNGEVLDVSRAFFSLAPGARLSFSGVTLTGVGAQDEQFACVDRQGVVRCVQSTVVLQRDIVLSQGSITLEGGTRVRYEQEEYYVQRATYQSGRDTSLWQVMRRSGTTMHGRSVLPTSSEQPVIVDTDRYVLEGNLTLTAKSPLHIKKSTTIVGRGHTLWCTPGAGARIILSPGVHLEFQDTYVEHLSPCMIQGTETNAVVWGDGSVVSLSGDGRLPCEWRCVGTVVLDGNGSTVEVATNTPLCVEADSIAHLRNICFSGVQGDALRCCDDSAQVHCHQVHIALSGDWTVGAGGWHWFGMSEIAGPHMLIYATSAQGSVESLSTLCISDECIVHYCPRNGRSDGLQCRDHTTTLMFSNAQLRTSAPCWLGSGRFVCKGSVVLRDEGGGIFLGEERGSVRMKFLPLSPCSVQVIGTVCVYNEATS